MAEIIYPLSATIIVSLLSLLGISIISIREDTFHKILFILISFSAGAILGAVFFDLLPEAIEVIEEESVFIYISIGFVSFFFLERFLYWYHGHGHATDIEEEHGDKARAKEFVYLNIIGDAVHNFLDGMVIAVTFLVSIPLGVATTVAVIFHELPQEFGDFGILVYGGLSRNKALLLNFLSAITAIIGTIFAYIYSINVEEFGGVFIALIAGGFIYLSASELIPELQREESLSKSAIQFVIFIIGLILLWSLGIIFPE